MCYNTVFVSPGVHVTSGPIHRPQTAPKGGVELEIEEGGEVMSDKSGALADVLTIGEVAAFWGKTLAGVRYHIDRGNFRWRYTESGRILVERDSVIGLWGQPTRDIDAGDIYDTFGGK